MSGKERTYKALSLYEWQMKELVASGEWRVTRPDRIRDSHSSSGARHGGQACGRGEKRAFGRVETLRQDAREGRGRPQKLPNGALAESKGCPFEAQDELSRPMIAWKKYPVKYYY
jgi:hypothetical protein